MSKKLKIWQIIFLAIVGLIFLVLKLWQWHWPKAIVELKGEKLSVLVADNFNHQYQGLGGRESLGEADGMLFIFGAKKKVGIVMRDMNFPIDIVWFDAGRVVDIAPRISPEPGVEGKDLRVYYPRLEANAVLELPAGWTEKQGLKIGDEIKVTSD